MFKALLTRLEGSKLVSEETGATAVEYGLIVGLIAVTLIGALIAVSGALNGLFGDIAGAL